MSSSHWISAKEAAQRLGYAPEYVARLCRQQSLEARRDGSTWSIREDSLDKFRSKVEQQSELRSKTLSRQFKKESKAQSPAPTATLAPKASRFAFAAPLVGMVMLFSAVAFAAPAIRTAFFDQGLSAAEISASLARVQSAGGTIDIALCKNNFAIV